MIVQKILSKLEEEKQLAEKKYQKYLDDNSLSCLFDMSDIAQKRVDVITEMIELIREVAKEEEWIPCSERLPSESERWIGHDITDAEPREFIVMVKGASEPTTGYYTPFGWVKDIYDKEHPGYIDEIVAWSFFPKPPAFCQKEQTYNNSEQSTMRM